MRESSFFSLLFHVSYDNYPLPQTRDDRAELLRNPVLGLMTFLSKAWHMWKKYVIVTSTPIPSSSVAPCYFTFAPDNIPRDFPSQLSHKLAPNAIHGTLDALLDHVPVGTPLGKFIDLFGPKDATKAVAVGDDGRELLGVRSSVDEIDLGQLAQGGKVQGQVGVAKRRNVAGVMIHIAAD